MTELTHTPRSGNPITMGNGKLCVPDEPVVPFIEGDGTGPDIWKASQHVFDEAVRKVYGGKKKIHWFEIYAGEKCFNLTGKWILDETFENVKKYRVAIKGPLTTPVGGGIRSLNVTLRQVLDLYACVRPVRWFKGVPSPVKHPERVNMTIYRENTEDVYAGIEWKEGTEEAKKLIAFIKDMGKTIRPDSGIGIKPMSRTGSARLVLKALDFAIRTGKPSVTITHKGNIMKFTEGAFKDWGYEACKAAHRDRIVTEQELFDDLGGKMPEGKILVKDRIADSMFQQVLLRPEEYSVVATPNLNGDYLSDALAAQVGGLGLAPGANMSDEVAMFEATHGTAPKYAGLDKINPGSVILSGCMMLEHMGWTEAARAIESGLEKTIAARKVTYDLARQIDGATELKCSEFAKAIADSI